MNDSKGEDPHLSWLSSTIYIHKINTRSNTNNIDGLPGALGRTSLLTSPNGKSLTTHSTVYANTQDVTFHNPDVTAKYETLN